MSHTLTLDGLLTTCKVRDGNPITHTRIGDVGLGIYGGSYSIPDDSMDDFWRLYTKDVIEGGKDSYLTEVQLKDAGPILIDLDERYNKDVTERQHQYGHIEDTIGLYIEKLQELVILKDDISFPCFIMEKERINSKVKDYVKDGIHIIMGINIPHPVQLLLRSMVLEDIDVIYEDLPLINTYKDLVDIGIPRGKTNWQIFGSKKPGNERYELTKVLTITINKDGDVFYKEEKSVKINEDFLKNISARNSNNIKLTLNDTSIKYIEQSKKKIKISKKGKVTIHKNKLDTLVDCLLIFPAINSLELCNAVIDKVVEVVMQDGEYSIKEGFELVDMLNEKYYGLGSYDNWIKVAWALKSISKFLYPAFLKMSSKSATFDWEANDCFEQWTKLSLPRELTMGSLKYWAKECNPEAYDILKTNGIDYFVYKSCEGETEYDVAKLVHNIFEDRFRCCNIRSKTWYEYNNSRWHNIESGTTLRQALSQKISTIYHQAVKKTLDKMGHIDEMDEDEDKEKALRKEAYIMSQMALKLKKTTWKQNIMRECSEVFYEANFQDKLDTFTHLLCFNNGVLDMNENIFRKGKPDDYLSLCTNTNYQEFDPTDPTQVIIRDEINEFMSQLFPNRNVCQYMWEHLASTLKGSNLNQTFNIYFGGGRNGKSKLVNLMGRVLGDYKGSVPLTIITQKRSNIGTASPEIAQLQGTRYAVMQEPSKNQKLNEGPFKELVGDDPLQGRALFKDTVTFIPQFKLAVCTNVLFDIKSNDDGTWRRIRIVDFVSKFVDNPSENPEDHEFKIDLKLDEKFVTWVPVFTSLLVEVLFKTGGIVHDCDEVMASSQKYKEQQDYFAGFMKDRVCAHPTGLLKKGDVYSEFQEWYSELYGGKIPSGKELYEYIEKDIGKPTKRGWRGYTLCHDYDQVDDDMKPNEIN